VRNQLLYFLLRAGSSAVARIPLWVSYALASVAGSVAFAVARPARRGIDANLALAFPQLSSQMRRRLALECFRHDALNWIDTLRIPFLDQSGTPEVVDVDRWDVLTDAIAAGNGVVMAMFHVGNYDLVGQAIAARGISLSVPVERIQPEKLYRFLVDCRSARGVQLLPVEHATRPLLAALRRGEVVGIAADRLTSGKGAEVDFFSRRCEFPRGPAALARRSGAVLLVGVGIRRPGRAFSGHVVPVDVPRTGDALADEVGTTQNLAYIAESFIRAHPGQWLAFSPVCPAPGRTNGT
jgi:KDO2-lipid IV(A) lauroyltransferase